MEWIPLENTEQLEKLNEASHIRPQLIYKHSTRCGISSMAKQRLYKNELPEDIDFFYLDLIKYRDISNKVAEMFGVRHESPQVLLIKNGGCIYHESHTAIYMDDIVAAAM